MADPGAERRCETCGELSPARAKFCLECGTQFEEGAPVGAPSSVDLIDQLPQENGSNGERRNVTVIFADLSGFTAYSEGSDVEDVRAIAQETAQSLGDIVERYGGTVDKIIGDCVMAVFGAPTAHEDDPERAVRTALDMQAFVEGNRDRFAGLRLSVGMQTGEAMWAPVGSDGRYTVLGDTVNTAARLQGAAEKGEVVIGHPTYVAVADAIECEGMEPIKAKNKAEPVPAWRAVSVKGERRTHKPVRASLAGREEELGRLHELWEHVRTERRAVGVTVIGSPGVGKTRLVSTLTDTVGSSALVLRGRCLPYGEGITYWPVIEIIQQAAGIRHDDATEAVSEKLGALLESLGSDDLDELRTMAVALANLIGAPTTPRGTYSATKISRGELHWGLRRIIELAAQNILPLVLVIEDLHWAEPTLLELIAYIFDSTAQAPILGISTARPEFKEMDSDLLTQHPNRRVIEIDALTDEAARRIVTELLGTADIPDGPFNELLHSAGGNPLFLEEIVQMWVDAGVTGEGASIDHMSVPSGLRALIDSRLDRLPPAERRIVSTAAVIGDVFWTGTLSHLAGTNGELADILESLESRDLIRSHAQSTVTGEYEYAFKHGLIRDAAYARLSKAERATLHERCGTWISQLPSGELEFAEVIAYHLEQACRTAAEIRTSSPAPTLAAVRALRRAGEKAEAREGMREAERFLGRALDLLGEALPETAVELRLRRARMMSGLGDLEGAYQQMQEAADAAQALERADLRCLALISLAETDVLMGRGSQARILLDDAQMLALKLDDAELRIRAAWIQASISERFDGSFEDAVDALSGAIAFADEVEDAERLLTGHMRLGVLYFNTGRLAAAQTEFERCIELAKEQGGLRHQAWVTAFLGLIRFHCGPRADADDMFERASDWFVRTNDLYMHIQTLVWRASLQLANDDVKSALKLLREAMPRARDMGGPLVADGSRYLAEALARQGRVAEAREVAASAREIASEDPLVQARLLLTEAFAAAASGDAVTARARAAEALPGLKEGGFQIDLGEAHLTYARLLVGMDDKLGAMRELELARAIFATIGALATVAEIDGELSRLRKLSIVETTDEATLERPAS